MEIAVTPAFREPRRTRNHSLCLRAAIDALEPRRLLSTVSLAVPLPTYTPTTLSPITLNLRDHLRSDSATGTDARLTFTYGLGTNATTGNIDLRLTDAATPKTVTNFLNYITTARFDGTVIHRSVPGFVLQGGNFRFVSADANSGQMANTDTDAQVPNEFTTAIRDGQNRVNTRGTLSMAKLSPPSQGGPPNGGPDSATNQFFINLADNSSNLDLQNGGFTTFASVTSGMDVADAIAAIPRFNASTYFQNGALDNLPLASFTTTPLVSANLITLSSASILTPGITFTATSSNPAFVVASISNYTLTLTPQGGTGSAVVAVTATDREGATLQVPITVVSPPTATLSVPASTPEGGSASVTIVNPIDPRTNTPSSLRYSYDFDNDGTFEVTSTASTSQSIPTALLADGPISRTVRVRVTDVGGFSSDVMANYAATNVAPTATITAPTVVPTGRSVTLTGSANDPSAADVAAGFSFAWSVTRVSNGQVVAQGLGADFSFTPDQAGDYTATLTATDKDSFASSAATVSITAVPSPTARLVLPNGGVDEGTTGATVSLTDLADPLNNDTSTLRFSFDLDDNGVYEISGATSATATLPNSLTADGRVTRTVRARVTDTSGISSDYSGTIVVRNVAPTPSFELPTSAVSRSAISLSAGATDPSAADLAAGITFNWTVTRGGVNVRTQAGATLDFTPPFPADYVFTLEARDRDAGTATLSKTLTVTSPLPTDTTAPIGVLLPVAPPAAATTNASVDLIFAFTDASGIDTSTLVDGLVSVALSGADRNAPLVSTSESNGVTFATFRFTPQAGILIPGVYGVTLQGNAVRDLAGNAAASILGTFSSDVVLAPRAGRRDPAFGNAGTTSQLLTATSARMLDASVRPDGATLLLGLRSTDTLVLARLTAGGTIDTGFASQGSRATALPAGVVALGANFDPVTDRIFITGRNATGAPVVVRTDLDGNLDTSFGTGGVLTVLGPARPANAASPLDASTTLLAALTLPRNRGLVLAGRVTSGGERLFVARVTTAGRLDTAFGGPSASAGSPRGLFTRVAAGEDLFTTLALEPDGDIVVGGTVNGQAFVQRLASTGRPARGTPATGSLLSTPGSAYGAVDRIVVDPLGRTLLSVTTAPDAAAAAQGRFGTSVVRLTTALQPDASFRDAGNQPGLTTLVADRPTGVALADGFNDLGRSKSLLARTSAGGVLSVSPNPTPVGTTLQTFRQQEDFADLVVSQLVLNPGTLKPGNSISSRATIVVDGSIPSSGKFSVQLILSSDDTLSQDDVLLRTSSVSFSKLAPGTSRSIDLRGALPRNLPNGNYKTFVRIISGAGGPRNDLTSNDLRLSNAAVAVQR